jgi:hypothetical protein
MKKILENHSDLFEMLAGFTALIATGNKLVKSEVLKVVPVNTTF